MKARFWLKKSLIIRPLDVSHPRIKEYLESVNGRYPGWTELIITNKGNDSLSFCLDETNLHSLTLGLKFKRLTDMLDLYHPGWGRLAFTKKQFRPGTIDSIEVGMLIRPSISGTHQYTFVDNIEVDAEGNKSIHCAQEGDKIIYTKDNWDKYRMTILMDTLDRADFESVKWPEKAEKKTSRAKKVVAPVVEVVTDEAVEPVIDETAP